MSGALSITAHSTLTECEAEMETCRDNIRGDFRRFGELLDKILTEELFLQRDLTLTKDSYCRQQWGFTLQRAHQIIQASKANPVEIASTAVDAISTVRNEWQARNLLHPPNPTPREFLNNEATWEYSYKYTPESELTPEMRKIRDDARARLAASDDDVEPDYNSPEYQFGSDYAAADIARRAGHYNVPLPAPEHYGLPEETQVRVFGENEFEVKKPHVAHNSGNNEWYTPAEYIEAARAVMGGFDFDPASSATANEVVQAAVYYSAEDDGLSKPWRGRIWMNPPYAGELIGKFAGKLCQHFDADEVTEAIVLVNNATETGWFQEMAARASAICFPRGRVKFWHPERESAPLQGQAVIYLGPSPDKFGEAFSSFGEVWGRL